MDQKKQMDRMYRLQRHFYDLTRKYYLFGRDRVLSQLAAVTGRNGPPRILEMGCGTGRNLIKLATQAPAAELFGIDASQAMLDTARAKAERAGVSGRITFATCLAEDTCPATFELDDSFDAVFFSYSLSMIPTWRDAVQAGLDGLRPGGVLWVVDFWDGGDIPELPRKLLFKWLHLFGVHFRPELIDHLRTVCGRSGCELDLQPVGPRYGFTASLRKHE